MNVNPKEMSDYDRRLKERRTAKVFTEGDMEAFAYYYKRQCDEGIQITLDVHLVNWKELKK